MSLSRPARDLVPMAVAAIPSSVLVGIERFAKVAASVLQTLPGFGNLDAALFHGKTIRQMGRGQVDEEGNDISGYFIVADAGSVMIFPNAKHSYRWANNVNQVNTELAPSLTYVPVEHISVSFIKLTEICTI